MNQVVTYIKEAYSELIYKVTWPTWSELQNSAVVVIIASLIIAGVVLLMDQASSTVLRALYRMIVG
jgi:preprotein translocase subunit SecE